MSQAPPTKRPRISSPAASQASAPSVSTTPCPHLSTVNRQVLDLDLKLHCSVTLSVHNVYICLVCSRYLQGRAPSTPAYTHSLQAQHHLFLCTTTLKTYCLPDNYPVAHESLREIAVAFRPTFTADQVSKLDDAPYRIRLRNVSRLTGAVPLVYLHAADYVSVTTQLLLRASRFRNCLLMSTPEGDHTAAGALKDALALLCSKIWSKYALRDFIAPHELLAVVETRSKGLFSSLKQNDPVLLLAWILRTLTGGARDNVGRIVDASFKGEMTVVETSSESDQNAAQASSQVTEPSEGNIQPVDSSKSNTKEAPFYEKKTSSFWFLPLDLPPEPLFKDMNDRTLVTQTTLERLMRKYDGITKQHVVRTAHQRSFTLLKIPECLLLVVKRFVKSKFGLSKNPCFVQLPENLNMSEWCKGGGMYELKAAILHEGRPRDGSYRVAIKHAASKSWFELNGNEAKPIHFQLVSLADTYILLYERTISNKGNAK